VAGRVRQSRATARTVEDLVQPGRGQWPPTPWSFQYHEQPMSGELGFGVGVADDAAAGETAARSRRRPPPSAARCPTRRRRRPGRRLSVARYLSDFADSNGGYRDRNNMDAAY
jgi:hypothetical protein